MKNRCIEYLWLGLQTGIVRIRVTDMYCVRIRVIVMYCDMVIVKYCVGLELQSGIVLGL